MLFPEPSSFELVQFFTLVLHLQIKMEKINDNLIYCTSLSNIKLHVLSSTLQIVVTALLFITIFLVCKARVSCKNNTIRVVQL